ncbi:uncharacterized protein LOC127705492 [Mytilus californianus]|uniref:uncharacterized protein LOC127705492 n=1 Tax=Mytilus californianus TaxID=6549 RepID=UPI0022473DD1|nr:uncharacterized protein LOC127705492 [Mytilus californianus]
MAENEAQFETFIPAGGYVMILIAVFIGLAIIGALLFVIIRGRRDKSQITGCPESSTGEPKPSALDFNKSTAFAREKYFKESKKKDMKKKKPFRKFIGQQPITSEQKRLFNNSESSGSNTSSPCNEEVERQSPEVVSRNKMILKKFFSNSSSKINALSKLSVVEQGMKNPSTDRQNKRGKTSPNNHSPRFGKTSSLSISNIDVVKSTDKNTGWDVAANRFGQSSQTMGSKRIVSGLPSSVKDTLIDKKAQKPSNSGWDVAATKFGQSSEAKGSKRIVGGLSAFMKDKIMEESRKRELEILNGNKKMQSVQKNFGISTNPNRYVWTKKHVKSQKEA